MEHQVTTLGKNDFYRQIIPEWVVGQFCFALSSSQNGERPVNIERMVLKNQMQTKGGKRWGIDPFLDAQAEYFKYKPPKDPRSKKAMVNDVFKLVLDNKIIFTNYGYTKLIQLHKASWMKLTWIGRDWEPAVRSVVDGTFSGEHPVAQLKKYYTPPPTETSS